MYRKPGCPFDRLREEHPIGVIRVCRRAAGGGRRAAVQVLARRGRRCPVGAQTVAAGAAHRLPCAARRPRPRPHRAPPAAQPPELALQRVPAASAAKGCLAGVRRACEAPRNAGFRARARSALRQHFWRRLFERSERSERSEFCARALDPSTAGQSVRSTDRFSRASHLGQTALCRHNAQFGSGKLPRPEALRFGLPLAQRSSAEVTTLTRFAPVTTSLRWTALTACAWL